MAVYLQMGHDSKNLLNMGVFDGVILSPVDETPSSMRTIIDSIGSGLDVIFDPQFYAPRTRHRNLRLWDSYYQSEIESSDLASLEWWSEVCRSLVNTSIDLGVSGICSPVELPRFYNSEYVDHIVNVGNSLYSHTRHTDVTPIQSAVLSLQALANPDTVMATASILSRSNCPKLLLIFNRDAIVRRELSNQEELAGAALLVQILSRQFEIIIGYCALELPIWKIAGAHHCATGKYFNLRRFAPSRFGIDTQEGRIVDYWTEESLFAFLRESDFLLLRSVGLIDPSWQDNEYSREIIRKFDNPPPGAWRALSWRQYLAQFGAMEKKYSASKEGAITALVDAKEKWDQIHNSRGIILNYPENNGQWVSEWLYAAKALED